MRSKVKKWGNSAVVRIPKALLEECHLAVESPIDIRVENGQIVVAPLQTHEYRLADLLAGITPDNLHGEVDFGTPEGDEFP